MIKNREEFRGKRNSPSKQYLEKPGAKELIDNVAGLNTAMRFLSILLKVVFITVLVISWKGYKADRTVKKFNLKQDNHDRRADKNWR